MTWTLANASKTTAVNAAVALANGGTLKIYDGTRPATPDTAITSQVLLVTLTFNATAAPSATNGVATLNAMTSGTAVATSTATWCRALTSGAATIGDGDVGTSAKEINLPTTSIVTGEVVSVSSGTWTQP